jgi:putative thioredoxin
LERLAIEGGGRFMLARVNVDENPNLAVRYGVQGIPAVKAFRNGEVDSQFVGAQPEGTVRRFVENLSPSPAVQAAAQGLSLLGTRHWAEAESSFRDILLEDETNAAAALGLLKTLVMQGKGAQSLDLIKDFPGGTEWPEALKLKPLAELLVEAEGDPPGDDGDALDTQLHRTAELIKLGNLPAAMDGLLDILREDKRYRSGFPKEVLLALYTILGDQDPLTREYRDELASVLF